MNVRQGAFMVWKILRFKFNERKYMYEVLWGIHMILK
jgi:hypothetical protein